MPTLRKDYYQRLGVRPGDDADTIKQAFRKLVKRHHPDRNPGARNEERFKEITEAYETLGDAARRKVYDASAKKKARAKRASVKTARTRSPKPSPQAAASSPTAEPSKGRDLFGFFRSFGRDDSALDADSELESVLSVTLEEAAAGTARKVNLGIEETNRLGKTKKTRKSLDLRIPAGIRDGQRIRLKGQGGGAKGEDLYIRIRIEPHADFTFEGDDLVAEIRVAPWEAALGCRIEAPTLEGKVALRIPEGVRSGQKLRLKQKGFPKKGSSTRGDLLYRIMIVVPSKLTPAERTYFEKLSEVSRFDPRKGS